MIFLPFHHSILMGVRWHLTVVLICICWVMSDVQHLPMYSYVLGTTDYKLSLGIMRLRVLDLSQVGTQKLCFFLVKAEALQW